MATTATVIAAYCLEHGVARGVMPTAKTSEDVKKDFGRFIQQARENSGLSQKYVAGKANLTVTQLSRIENGQSGTKRDTVILLAQVIGIDEVSALKVFSPESFITPENLGIIGTDDLDEDDLKDIADYINFKRAQKAKNSNFDCSFPIRADI